MSGLCQCVVIKMKKTSHMLHALLALQWNINLCLHPYSIINCMYNIESTLMHWVNIAVKTKKKKKHNQQEHLWNHFANLSN